MTFIDFFCRGSSKKDFIDINEKLIILFLHEGGLYKWSEQEKDKLVHLFDTEAEKFIHVADNKFMLLQNCYDDQNTSQLIGQQILMLDIDFVSQHHEPVFEIEEVYDERIINFSYDSQKGKLLLCLKQQKEENKNRIAIYDLQNKEEPVLVFNYFLKEDQFQEVYGRLQQGNFKFIGDHIYYGENVIKIRYDLIESVHSIDYSARQIFDVYRNIFDLQDNKQVLVNGPFVSYAMNKLIYVIKDTEKNVLSKLMVLPYLHENKIRMLRNKMNTNYFYTTIDREVDCLEIDSN